MDNINFEDSRSISLGQQEDSLLGQQEDGDSLSSQQQNSSQQRNAATATAVALAVLDVADSYHRETLQVWTRAGIPSNPSPRHRREFIHAASIEDLRALCTGSFTAFDHMAEQLSEVSQGIAQGGAEIFTDWASIVLDLKKNITNLNKRPTSPSRDLLMNISLDEGVSDEFANKSSAQSLAIPLSAKRQTTKQGGRVRQETSPSGVCSTQKTSFGKSPFTQYTIPRRKRSLSGASNSPSHKIPSAPRPTFAADVDTPTRNRNPSLPTNDDLSGSSMPASRSYLSPLLPPDDFADKQSPFSLPVYRIPNGHRKSIHSRLGRNASVASFVGKAPLQYTHSVVATTDNDDGFTMINGYVILDELGSGSFGKVMLGFNTKEEKLVAIKSVTKGPRLQNLDLQAVTSEVLQSLPPAERRRLQTIQSEIAVMKDLRHQNLVALHEVMDDPSENKLYLVLQYVDDGVLADVSSGKLHPLVTSVNGFVSAFRQIATGLEYLHRHHVLHRDLKPENVLVDTRGNVCIADFGVSESLANKKVSENMGTILFTAPELLCLQPSADIPSPEHSTSSNVLRVNSMTLETTASRPTISASSNSNGENIDDEKKGAELTKEDVHSKYATDMWALGVMMYYLLYRKLPFDTVDSIRNDDVVYPDPATTAWWNDTVDHQTGSTFTDEQVSSRRAMVSQVEKLLRRLLDKDPSHRATAHEARLSLKEIGRYLEDRCESKEDAEVVVPQGGSSSSPKAWRRDTTAMDEKAIVKLVDTNAVTGESPENLSLGNDMGSPFFSSVHVDTPSLAQMESILQSVNKFRRQRGSVVALPSRRGSVVAGGGGGLGRSTDGTGNSSTTKRGAVSAGWTPRNSVCQYMGEDTIDAQLVMASLKVSNMLAAANNNKHQNGGQMKRTNSSMIDSAGESMVSAYSPRQIHFTEFVDGQPFIRQVSSARSVDPTGTAASLCSSDLRVKRTSLDLPPSISSNTTTTTTTTVDDAPPLVKASLQQQQQQRPEPIPPPPPVEDRSPQPSMSKYLSSGGNHPGGNNYPTAFISRIKRVSKEQEETGASPDATTTPNQDALGHINSPTPQKGILHSPSQKCIISPRQFDDIVQVASGTSFTSSLVSSSSPERRKAVKGGKQTTPSLSPPGGGPLVVDGGGTTSSVSRSPYVLPRGTLMNSSPSSSSLQQNANSSPPQPSHILPPL